jgi:putative acyl-CoA dehydrogenase
METRAVELGQRVGSEEAIRWGFQANEYPPVLRTHDRFGGRIDQVDFHPAWHELMRLSMAHGVHNLPWTENRAGAHAGRAALMMLVSQNEQGHTCPLSMTCSSVPVLRKQLEAGAEWESRLRACDYGKSALIGMAMTEKQGGSDLRANTSVAEFTGADEYLITGHKWFCSAPMADAFLVLAQAPGGLTCFLMPRGPGFRIQRLKSKLGNRSNASGEVEFDRAWARRLGPEGRGVATIIDMVQHTRLDCTIGSAALMRQALVQAIHHAAHRKAFGRLLIDQPIMQNVLADLSLDSEAATVLMMRLARAFEKEPGLARLGTAVAKYWVCKRAPFVVSEALECLGGNGFIEECVMPRLYREAPVNSIWEGSGNVICLDILRAMQREPVAMEALVSEIQMSRGANAHFDTFIRGLAGRLKNAVESEARQLAESLALALEASLLIRCSPPFVSDAFCASRLTSEHGRLFGTLPPVVEMKRIIDRQYVPQ